MSVTSTRTLQIGFSGDVSYQQPFSAADNDTSPGQIDIITLTVGNNAINPPVVSGVVLTALTIIPPSANPNVITLKGVSGDTGIPLHLTDPTSIGLDTSFTSLVLNVATEVDGVRLIWS